MGVTLGLPRYVRLSSGLRFVLLETAVLDDCDRELPGSPMFGLDVWPNSVLRVRVTARRFLGLQHLVLVQRDCKAKTESTTSAIIVGIASLAPNILGRDAEFSVPRLTAPLFGRKFVGTSS